MMIWISELLCPGENSAPFLVWAPGRQDERQITPNGVTWVKDKQDRKSQCFSLNANVKTYFS